MTKPRFLENSVIYTGDKAHARYRLFEDLYSVGISCPRVLGWNGERLELERIRGVDLATARRFKALDNPDMGYALHELARSGVASGCIVDGLRPQHVLFDGQAWFIVGGAGLRGVTDKRARRTWAKICSCK